MYARYFWEIWSKLLHDIFGIAELMLKLVDVADGAFGGHYSGSLMVLLAICISFCGMEKGKVWGMSRGTYPEAREGHYAQIPC